MTKLRKFLRLLKENREAVIRTSYVIPILIAAGISVYHVVIWYGMSNPLSWAIYLSIGVEIAALSALAGMTAKMNKFVYVPFVLVTMIQIIGNIFGSFEFIDINSPVFKDWVLLVDPIFDSMGVVDEGDLLGHRRFLGILSGIFIPVISLSFLHLLVSRAEKQIKESGDEPTEPTEPTKPIEPTETEEEEIVAEIIEDEVVEKDEEEGLETEKEISEDEENVVYEITEENTLENNFENFVKEKKMKLQEDRKTFLPLLDIFYNNGEIKAGDVMPTYPEFISMVDPSKYSDDSIKMFLTLCNYLEVTDLKDNIRTSKVSYEDAKNVLNKYLSLDDKKENKDNDKKENKDWWNKNNKS